MDKQYHDYGTQQRIIFKVVRAIKFMSHTPKLLRKKSLDVDLRALQGD